MFVTKVFRNCFNKVIIQNKLHFQFSFKASATDIKKLRDFTGSGINDCKNALSETEGDFQKAVEILKEKGLSMANRRSSKDTEQGVIGCKIGEKKGILVQINCETDFVAKCDMFIEFTENLLDNLLHSEIVGEFVQEEDISNLLKGLNKNNMLGSDNLHQCQQLFISKIQENIRIRRISIHKVEENECLGMYVHNTYDKKNSIGQTGCILIGKHKNQKKDLLNEVMNNLSLMIVGNSPQYLYREQIQKEVREAQIQKINEELDEKIKKKPIDVLNKIIDGKLTKFYQDSCLMDMHYFLDVDANISVEQYLKDQEQILNDNICIQKYITWKVGDQIN